MDPVVNEQYPPQYDPLIPPQAPTYPPQQQIEQVDYHAHLDHHYAEIPLDANQQIELVEYQLPPPQQYDQHYVDQRQEELNPENEEELLQQQQNEFQNQNMENAADYAGEEEDNSGLFQHGGSLEFSRVPEDLQPKLRKEYFKVLRAHDVLLKQLENIQKDNHLKDQMILQLNQLMEQKDEQLLSLMPKLSFEGSLPEGAPSPKSEYPQGRPEPAIVAAINFSAERHCLHQQIKLNNEKIAKLNREAIDSNAKQEKRCTNLKLKLYESNQQWAKLEVEKSSLAKQIQEKDEQLMTFKTQMDRFEKFKNQELNQMAIERAKLTNATVQLKARLTQFEAADSERINLTRNALNLQQRAEVELKRFKKFYYKDVRSLLDQKKNLTQELNESKLYLGSEAKQQNLKRKFKDLHPQLFCASDVSNLEISQNDFFHVLIGEKDKNIRLQKRVKELEKLKRIDVEMLIKNTLDQDSVPPEEEIPPLIQVNTLPDKDSESKSFNGLQEYDLNDLKIGDRYISLIATTERFWTQNKSLSTKLETLEIELNEAQQQNGKLAAQLEQSKLSEAKRNSKQLKQNLDIQSRFANAELAIEENRQLRARLEERNAKLKQLDENLVAQSRENAKWLSEMKLAQFVTQQAEDRVNGLSETIIRLEAEMVKLKEENEERFKRLVDEHAERLKRLDEEQEREMNDLIQQWNRSKDELKNKRHKLRHWKVAIVGLKRRIALLTNQEYDSTVDDEEFEDEPDSEDDDFGGEVGESGGEVDESDSEDGVQ